MAFFVISKSANLNQKNLRNNDLLVQQRIRVADLSLLAQTLHNPSSSGEKCAETHDEHH